jgi:cell shape-determining protein MreC
MAAMMNSSQQDRDLPSALDMSANRSNEPQGLQAENEKLREQLQQAQRASERWQHLHSELHSVCVNKLLKTSG